jgi:hypothetical protein
MRSFCDYGRGYQIPLHRGKRAMSIKAPSVRVIAHRQARKQSGGDAICRGTGMPGEGQ